MTDDDETERSWLAAAREKLPYAIGVAGLIAWFVLLYFMLRNV